jgi:hypothetical protein
VSNKEPPTDSKPPNANRTPDEIALYVDIEHDKKFRIAGTSHELEQIGDLLRGKQKFSVVNSLVIPALASIITTLVILTFQYVSWLNSVRIQNARNTAVNAEAVYKDVVQKLGQRGYESQFVALFMRELTYGGNWQENGLIASIYTFDELRVASYYKAIADWNYGYDRMITDIAYKIDRPIFEEAQAEKDITKPISDTQLGKVDCTQSLPEQVTKIGYDHRSLKAQFSVIAFCYRAINSKISDLRDKSLADKDFKIDDQSVKEIEKRLSDESTMANVFRCEAQHRLDFYNREVEFAILSPATVYSRLGNGPKKRAAAHFETTDLDCSHP